MLLEEDSAFCTLPTLHDHLVHLGVGEFVKEVLFIYLLPVSREEGQFLELFFELYEELEYAVLVDVLLEEATDIEALLIEDEVDKGNIIQDVLLAASQALEAILQKFAFCCNHLLYNRIHIGHFLVVIRFVGQICQHFEYVSHYCLPLH